MAISVSCSCGRALRIKDDFAGRKIRCPECKSILTVPAAEAEPEGEMLEVVHDDEPARPSSRRSAIQAEPPEVLPARRREEDQVTDVRRRDDNDRPVKRRPKLRREEARRGVSERGGFGSTNAGVVGGLLMILIAVVWFVLGLAFDRLFFYPPILLVIGIIAIVKGLAGGGD